MLASVGSADHRRDGASRTCDGELVGRALSFPCHDQPRASSNGGFTKKGCSDDGWISAWTRDDKRAEVNAKLEGQVKLGLGYLNCQ